MVWDLKLREPHAYAASGSDQAKKLWLLEGLLKSYTEDKTKRCLQVGVQSRTGDKYGDNWTSLDPYDTRACIDMREKLEENTLPDEAFDFIVCNAILEHVEDPFACAQQLYRVCRKGGQVWAEVPFVQPYHPYKTWEIEHGMFDKVGPMDGDTDHGGDYWRFTPQGIVQLMKPFRMKEVLLIDDGGILFYGEKD